jgi:hypothetical protein
MAAAWRSDTRGADIHSRRNKVFVCSKHQMESGAHLGQDDPIVMDLIDLEGIATTVRTQLKAYKAGVPNIDWSAFEAPKTSNLLTAAGVRSWSTFGKGAKFVTVRSDGDQATLTPWAYAGAGNYVPLEGQDRTLPLESPELGAEVVAALAEATD